MNAVNITLEIFAVSMIRLRYVWFKNTIIYKHVGIINNFLKSPIF